ncbi:MAG TPA: type II toxin-antitoxin system RelE/ParE family toxin [Acetobacteraceae bacterium]
MSQPARFSARARREVVAALEAMEHIAARRRLRLVIETAARRIGQYPALGRNELSLADARYRFWSISGFPYLLVYRSDTSPPSIVRFVHTARDLPPLLAELRESPDSPKA